MNYYEHHLGDYAKDAGHLSMLEDGAYRRLLDAYYTRERALPVDVRECCKLARATSKPERDAVAYVLREFFALADDGYHQTRADVEIARFRDKQRKAKASADARWAQSDRNANASPDAMRTHSEGNAPRARPQSPDTRHQTPEETKTVPLLQKAATESASPQSVEPPSPPAYFTGLNAEELNGKAVVALGASWELPEDWGMDALALGFKPGEVLREAEKFRQFWTKGRGAGKRRSVKGWRQSWSNWLGKAEARETR